MSGQPNQPKRPWVLRMRRQSFRTGTWQPWRTHATYVSQERAEAAKSAQLDAWTRSGFTVEGYVRHKSVKGP